MQAGGRDIARRDLQGGKNAAGDRAKREKLRAGEREGCPGQRNDSPRGGGIRAATGRRGQGERETTRGSPAARAKVARDTATIPRRRRAKALRAIYAKGGRVGLHRGGRGRVIRLLPFPARRGLGVRAGGAAARAAARATGTGGGKLPPAAAQREEQRDGEQQKHPRVAPGHAETSCAEGASWATLRGEQRVAAAFRASVARADRAEADETLPAAGREKHAAAATLIDRKAVPMDREAAPAWAACAQAGRPDFPRIRKAPTGARPGTLGRTPPTRGTAQTR